MSTLVVRLEDCIKREYGPSELAAVRLRAAADVAGDSQVAQADALLRAVCYVRRRPPSEVYVWAGAQLAPSLLKDGPDVLTEHESLRTMLLQVNAMAPRVLDVLSPGTKPPEFWEDLMDGETTRIAFDGAEEIAWVLEGFARGVCTYFAEWVMVTRGMAPAILKERQIIEVKIRPERRTSIQTPPSGGERRNSGGFGGIGGR